MFEIFFFLKKQNQLQIKQEINVPQLNSDLPPLEPIPAEESNQVTNQTNIPSAATNLNQQTSPQQNQPPTTTNQATNLNQQTSPQQNQLPTTTNQANQTLQTTNETLQTTNETHSTTNEIHPTTNETLPTTNETHSTTNATTNQIHPTTNEIDPTNETLPTITTNEANSNSTTNEIHPTNETLPTITTNEANSTTNEIHPTLPTTTTNEAHSTTNQISMISAQLDLPDQQSSKQSNISPNQPIISTIPSPHHNLRNPQESSSHLQIQDKNSEQQTADPQARMIQEISNLKNQLTSYKELLFQVFQKFSALEQQISVVMDSIKK